MSQAASTFSVATNHIHVDAGWSIPWLASLFTAACKLTLQTIAVSMINGNLKPSYFLVICGQFNRHQLPPNCDSCKLLIFPQGVCLRTGD
jgi:hypothetical protein